VKVEIPVHAKWPGKPKSGSGSVELVGCKDYPLDSRAMVLDFPGSLPPIGSLTSQVWATDSDMQPESAGFSQNHRFTIPRKGGRVVDLGGQRFGTDRVGISWNEPERTSRIPEDEGGWGRSPKGKPPGAQP
jgi:hypothetical protein